jgi:hypothetical protein
MAPKKIIGILLIIAAAAGMLFSVAGIVAVWQVQPRLVSVVNENLALIKQSLDATEEGLNIIDQSIKTITEDVKSMQTATETLSKQIKNSIPALDSMATMTGTDLPDAIKSAQTSLAAAQSSAQLIDSIMSSLSNLPFSIAGSYKPDVPLHTALGQVSDSLNNIPSSLELIHTSISASKSNLDVMETELNTISASVKEITENLSNAQKVTGQYHTILSTFIERVETTQKHATEWIVTAAWLLTFLLVWFVIAQLGLLVQGLDLLKETRVSPAVN